MRAWDDNSHARFSHMKIATLNTWKNEGNYPLRLETMELLFRESAPDIILLQEVLSVPTLERHTGKTLARNLDYDLVDAPARRTLRKIDGQPYLSYSGLSILSRLPVEDFLKVNLPTSVAGGERIALLMRTIYHDRPLIIGNIHLSHLRDEQDIKKRQWMQAIRSSHDRWGTLPILIGGDMNTNLDRTSNHALFSYHQFQVVDTYAAAPQAASDSTHPLPPKPNRPGRRIDTIFLVQEEGSPNPGIIPIEARIGGKALLTPKSVYPSDHAMVEVTFHIPDA